MIPIENKTPWGLILILFGAGLLSAFQVGKVPPVLTDIRTELMISLFHAGWLLSVFNLTGLLLGMVSRKRCPALRYVQSAPFPHPTNGSLRVIPSVKALQKSDPPVVMSYTALFLHDAYHSFIQTRSQKGIHLFLVT
ncbi:MAG: hypothetical protein KAH09_10010, partial [Desulfobacula sp.]|nr:hypothetical protein [Desulfobacula sp.]